MSNIMHNISLCTIIAIYPSLYHIICLYMIGDWGTQFGMLIHFLKTKYPDQMQKRSAQLTSPTTTSPTTSTTTATPTTTNHNNDSIDLQLEISDLMSYYRQAKKLFDEEPEFKSVARQEVVKLQNGDKDSILVWNAICDKSRIEFNKIYNMLNITLIERGESFYNPYLAPLVEELKVRNILYTVLYLCSML